MEHDVIDGGVTIDESYFLLSLSTNMCKTKVSFEPVPLLLLIRFLQFQKCGVVWYFRVRTIFREPSSLRSSNSAHEKVRTRKNRSTK